MPLIVGLATSESEGVRTLAGVLKIVLEFFEFAITLHLNCAPASDGLTVIVGFVDPAILVGETQETSTLTAFCQTPGEHVSVWPGITLPVIAGTVVYVGAVRSATCARVSTEFIPARMSFW